MGRLSDLRARGGGPRPRNPGGNRNPLRRIVADWYEHGRRRERLECGHEQYAVRDLMGETNAIRRRCAKCARPTPAPGDTDART